MRTRFPFLSSLGAGVCALLLTSCAMAATYQWTGVVSGDWSDPANWTPTGGPPADGDTALLTSTTAPNTSVVYSSGTTILAGLTLASGYSLNIINGTLGCSGDASIESGASLALSGNSAVFSIGGTASVAGILQVPRGTLTGSGRIDIQSGATAYLANLSTIYLDGVELDVEGDAEWQGYSLYFRNGASLRVGSGGTFSASPAAYSLADTTADCSIVNHGTFQHTGGSGDITCTVPITSDGTLDFGGGDFNLNTSRPLSITGTLRVHAPARLIVNSGAVMTVSSLTLEGDGTLLVHNDSSLHLAGDLTVPSGFTLQLGSTSIGFLTGSGNLTVDGTLTCATAYLEGTGLVTVGHGGNATLGLLRQMGQDMENAGTVTWSSGAWYQESGARFTNQAPGVLEITTASTLGDFGGAGGLVNHGTIRRSANTLNHELGVPVDSDGTISVQSGDLSLNFAGTAHLSGTLDVAGGARFILGNSNLVAQLEDLTLQGTGTVLVNNGADVELVSDLTLPAGMVFDLHYGSSTLEGTGTLTVAGTFRTEGNIEGSGDVVIQSGGSFESYGFTTINQRTVRNSGTFSWDDTSWTLGQGASVVNEAGGVLRADSYGNVAAGSGGGSIVNHGTLDIAEGNPTADVLVDVPVTNDGTIVVDDPDGGVYFRTGGITNQAGGTLAGNGRIGVYSGTSFTNDGVISPGLSPGTLHFPCEVLPNGSGASWEMEIRGRGEGEHDRVDASDELQLDGSLAIELVGAFAPVLSDTFDIATFGSVTGSFAAVTGDSPGTCLDWLVYPGRNTLWLHVTSQGPLLTAWAGVQTEPVTLNHAAVIQAGVSNRGPVPATGTVLTVTLPASLSFTAATPSQGSCSHTAGTVTCDLGDLRIGGSASVSVNATAVDTGTAAVDVGVAADECDPVATDDHAHTTFRLVTADACDADANGTVTKEDLPATVDDIFTGGAPGNPDCTRSGGVTAADLAAIIDTLDV